MLKNIEQIFRESSLSAPMVAQMSNRPQRVILLTCILDGKSTEILLVDNGNNHVIDSLLQSTQAEISVKNIN